MTLCSAVWSLHTCACTNASAMETAHLSSKELAFAMGLPCQSLALVQATSTHKLTHSACPAGACGSSKQNILYDCQ